MKSIQTQTIALAGCFQALEQINSLATSGKWQPELCEPLIKSLYIFDPDNAQDILNVDDAQPGLRYMTKLLRRGISDHSKVMLRYLLQMQMLERHISKNDEKMRRIRQRLIQLEPDASFDWLNNTHMQRLDGLYQEVFSTERRRIMISGEAHHLQNDLIAARIRALLLVCFRLTILWQQKGGSRLKMLVSSKQYYQTASQLLH